MTSHQTSSVAPSEFIESWDRGCLNQPTRSQYETHNDFLCDLAVFSVTSAVKIFGMLNDITSDIIGCAIRIHRKLGPGLLESAYEACMSYELQKLGRTVERQKPVPLIYEEVKLDCGFRADLVVDSAVALELKCKDALRPVDEAQILSHLRLLNLKVGLLINFHVAILKDGIKRMVNDYIERAA